MSQSAAEMAQATSMSRALEDAGSRLVAAGVESARLDAELLLAAALGVTRTAMLTERAALSDDALKRFESMLARRERREPVAYILGHKEFYSLDFEVSSAVLIPRPETEMLVSAALESMARLRAPRVLDLGTGSGAIAIAIAVNSPNAQVTATDISADALEVARRNATTHRVADRVTLRLADCFDVRDAGAPLGRFDLIAANPPYIDDGAVAGLMADVRDYEPRVALSGGGGAGADGLEFYRRIAAGAQGHLEAEGEVIVEVGAAQSRDVVGIFERAGLNPLAVIDDLAGLHRVVRAARV
ncbi:MAG TPA: peptide chain release factor N(5)-glutamine methyltransferase [Candidatus Acidoferrales bacterium]|nr:peptide chain release factor N(5)-glutamine methyltransferase [Candidatus Acidoferrales bacterium]